jgi:hypothetical protein
MKANYLYCAGDLSEEVKLYINDLRHGGRISSSYLFSNSTIIIFSCSQLLRGPTHYDVWIGILIPLFTLMRIRIWIQLPKRIRIHEIRIRDCNHAVKVFRVTV